jgi:hypothetical protein
MNIFMALVLLLLYRGTALPNPSTNPWIEARVPKAHQSLIEAFSADKSRYVFY